MRFRIVQITALGGAGLLASASATICDKLELQLPGKVILPNTPAYDSHNNYWSARQDELTPNCFVAPSNTQEVVTALQVLKFDGASFTIKSGGHSSFPASNIEDGVTIDLGGMKQLSLSQDRQTLSVGPGNRWVDVANFLDPEQLAVVGGRVGDVGVSGLTLGGGISWLSGEYGWACDNVRAFEVVLASGNVVTASPTSNQDLYWALRGGGAPNFGVVTRFDFATFAQGDIWYKEAAYHASSTNSILQHITDLTVTGLEQDKRSHATLFVAYQPALGGVMTQVLRWHRTPPPPGTIPAVFQPLEAVPEISQNSASVNFSTMLGVYPEPYGFRKGWWDTTVKASASLLEDVAAAYGTWLEANFPGREDIVPVLLIQPLTVNTLTQMQKNGGNALGLKPSDGPLIKINVYVTWFDASLDTTIGQKATELVGTIETLALQQGKFNGYMYINTAEKSQPVYNRYGIINRTRLTLISVKYDLFGFFRQKWQGYFKLL